jgi:hypothetical protein
MFLHRRKLMELITDPNSRELSMSRFMLPWVCLLDAAWTYAVVKGWPPKEAFGPVSSMLGVVTGAICGIYAGSSIVGAYSRYTNLSQMEIGPSSSSGEPPPRAKPAPPESR